GARGWRYAGARVGRRNTRLARRKRATEARQVAAPRGKKAEPESGCRHPQDACQARLRYYVAKSQRKESRSTEMNVRRETGPASIHVDRGSRPVLHHAKCQN